MPNVPEGHNDYLTLYIILYEAWQYAQKPVTFYIGRYSVEFCACTSRVYEKGTCQFQLPASCVSALVKCCLLICIRYSNHFSLFV